MKNYQSCNLDELVELYDTELLLKLDKHAQIIHRKSSNQKRELWYGDKIQTARRELRSYESMWNKTNSSKDKEFFFSKKSRFENTLQEAQSHSYAKSIDENIHDQGQLFKTVKKIIHRVKEYPLPKADTPENDFNSYFNTKIDKIRSKFDDDFDNAPSGISAF